MPMLTNCSILGQLCVCMSACTRVCVYTYVYVCVCVCVCAPVRVCALRREKRKLHCSGSVLDLHSHLGTVAGQEALLIFLQSL